MLNIEKNDLFIARYLLLLTLALVLILVSETPDDKERPSVLVACSLRLKDSD